MHPSPPPEFSTCLGDLYSIAWMENAEHANLTLGGWVGGWGWRAARLRGREARPASSSQRENCAWARPEWHPQCCSAVPASPLPSRLPLACREPLHKHLQLLAASLQTSSCLLTRMPPLNPTLTPHPTPPTPPTPAETLKKQFQLVKQRVSQNFTYAQVRGRRLRRLRLRLRLPLPCRTGSVLGGRLPPLLARLRPCARPALNRAPNGVPAGLARAAVWRHGDLGGANGRVPGEHQG